MLINFKCNISYDFYYWCHYGCESYFGSRWESGFIPSGREVSQCLT